MDEGLMAGTKYLKCQIPYIFISFNPVYRGIWLKFLDINVCKHFNINFFSKSMHGGVMDGCLEGGVMDGTYLYF